MSRIWNPFRSLVWPGLGPTVDWARAWPEPVLIAAGVLLYGRGVPLTGHLSLLLAGLGAWWLGVVLGIGQLGRTWAGLTFVFAGAAATVFGQNQPISAAGYAWMPWALAWGLSAIQEQRRLYAAFAAVALALMLVSSGFGLVQATMLLFAFLILCSALRLQARPRPSVMLAWRPASIAVIVTVLGLGLAAVRLLPTLAGGAATPELSTALSAADPGLMTLLAAFFVKPAAPATFGVYVGSLPLLCLVGLLWGGQRQPRQPLWGLGALGILALMAAASGWLTSGHLSVSLLVWATLSVVMLAGAGLDVAWAQARANTSLSRIRVPEVVVWAAARVGVVALPGLAVWAVSHLYVNNRPLLVAVSGLGDQLTAADLLRFDLARYPVAFWIGVAMSTVSFVGVLALIIGDQRARRQRIETEAVYEGGALRPIDPIDLPDGTPVHVTVSPTGSEEDLPEEAAQVAAQVTSLPAEAIGVAVAKPPGSRPAIRDVSVAETTSWVAWLLFGLGLFVYLGTRLWGIERFPIFFFTDEATFPLLAEQLLKQGLRDGRGSLFPLYFEVAGNRWTPVLAVYAHLPVVAVFGKSMLATRITAALVTVLTPIAISFIFKSVFRLRYWWVGTLLTAVVPTWFLHSRTGFEWLMMASFYACFLLSYLLYRTRSPRFLWLAVVFGAATFYNHSSGQLVMVAATLLLLISDFPYHVRQWRVVLVGIILALILAIPFLRLQSQNSNALVMHLRTLDSYWFRDIPLADKLQQFASRYLYGLSPAYWFIPNQHDLIRHRMTGYGNLGFMLLPFVVIGLIRVLVGFRSAAHRAVLLAAIAAPAGAAMADVAITRMMAFVPPAVILGGLGLDWFLGWLGGLFYTRSAPASGAAGLRTGQRTALALVTWVALTGASGWMLRDALTNGPTWYTEYGLYGMQYGARQLFAEAIPEILAAEPDTTVMVSPNWANGADTFVRFFFPPAQQFTRVQMHDVAYFMVERRSLSSDMLFVMTPEEYAQAQASGKFSAIIVSRTVPYPDGRVGFYFARLTYAADLDAILAREREERSRPVVESLELAGQLVEVSHSRLDIGLLPNIFDGDTFTLVRGLEANPLVFEFTFPEPRVIQGIEMTFGSMDFTLTAQLTGAAGEPPTVYSETFRGLPPDPTAGLMFDRGPAEVQKLCIEVLQLNAGLETHIHVRELQFK